jgi:regulator of PEP synthase PpsR (kinase-PPPase family)
VDKNNNMKNFNLHLISDSTGETLCSIARAVIAQFEDVKSNEFLWPMVRNTEQLEKVLAIINKYPGVIMYTIVEKELRIRLKSFCNELKIPCIPVLSKVINEVSEYLQLEAKPTPGKQHELDEEYFTRVDAVNFSIAHDDGQSTWDVDKADIIIIGASRTSKSPTSIYLAYRGFRTANIPFVLGCPLPENLFKLTTPLIVGLTISPERLIQIRKNRLLAIKEEKPTDYVDVDKVKEEILAAKRICVDNRWPIIDVTKRSVEETAATIIQYYQKHKKNFDLI